MTGSLKLPDGREVEVHDGLTIGRVASCDVVLDDNKVSRRHVRLIVEAGVVEVEDLESRNGTLLNGSPVTRRLLRDGDTLTIGTTAVEYRESASVGGGAPGAAAVGPAPGDDLLGGGEDLLAGGPVGDTVPTARRGSASEPAAEPRAVGEERAAGSARAVEPECVTEPKPTTHARRGAQPKADAEPKADAKPKADDVDVIEFVDEVVTVRKAPAEQTAPASRPAGAVARAATGRTAGRREHGVLQFSKQSKDTGVLGDDVAQLGGLPKLLLVLLAIAVAGGLGYLAMQVAQG